MNVGTPRQVGLRLEGAFGQRHLAGWLLPHVGQGEPLCWGLSREEAVALTSLREVRGAAQARPGSGLRLPHHSSKPQKLSDSQTARATFGLSPVSLWPRSSQSPVYLGDTAAPTPEPRQYRKMNMAPETMCWFHSALEPTREQDTQAVNTACGNHRSPGHNTHAGIPTGTLSMPCAELA